MYHDVFFGWLVLQTLDSSGIVAVNPIMCKVHNGLIINNYVGVISVVLFGMFFRYCRRNYDSFSLSVPSSLWLAFKECLNVHCDSAFDVG